MRQLSFKRYRFPPDIVRYAIWLYTRFTLSFRDIALSAQVNHGHHMRMSALTAMSGSTSSVAVKAPTVCV